MTFNKKHFTLTALAFSFAGLAACGPGPEMTAPEVNGEPVAEEDLPGEGVSVTAGYSVLEELFQTEIVNLALEELGYTIESGTEIEYATLHVDLAAGGIDYTAVHWEELHNDFYDNSGGSEVFTRKGVIVDDALQGYAIDLATAEEYDITTIDQLQDPEIASLFDTDGDGRANLAGCNPGWGCELVIEHHLDAYDLRDTVQHDQGQYFAIMADTITRYEQGEPILYYTWTPLWVSSVLVPDEDVRWLEVPYTDLPAEQGDKSEEDTTVDGTNLGFAMDQIRILANNEFLAENPAADRLFDLVSIPIEDVNEQNQLMRDGEDSPADVRRHAEEWVANNQAQFDDWVEEARATAQ